MEPRTQPDLSPDLQINNTDKYFPLFIRTSKKYFHPYPIITLLLTTMARGLYFTHYEPRSPPPSPPASQPTNTLAVTSLPRSFFDPAILNMLRDHFASFGEINQWVPLQGFGRIIIVYESEHHAETVKRQCDPIVVEDTLDQ